MKKFILVAAVCMFALACSSKDESFTFVHMSDPQIGFPDDPDSTGIESSKWFHKAISEVNAIKPAIVIITGDLVNHIDDTTQIQAYNRQIDSLDKDIKLITLPGNHDMRPYTPQTRESFLRRNGYERYSYTYGNCAFIGIDSNCIKEGADSLEKEQWDWLEKELKKAKKCNHRFLFVHCPVVREDIDEVEDYFNFPKDKRQLYIDLCNKYKVDAFFSGHTHKAHNAKFGYTEFINAGAVGFPLDGGVRGYNVIKVTPDSYSRQWVEL